VDGNEFKVKCKYCSRLLNARYKQLFQHSVSSKHLSSAAAATTVSIPVDVDGCKAADTSVHLPQDEETVTDTEGDEGAGESTTDDARSSNIQHFGDDVSDAADNIRGHRKVGHYIPVLWCF